MLSSAAAKLRTSASTEVMLVTGWSSAGSDWVSFAVAVFFFFLTANHSERGHLCSPSNFRETLCWSRPSPTRALKTAAVADKGHWEHENRIFFTLCNQLQILQHLLSRLHKWGILMKGGNLPWRNSEPLFFTGALWWSTGKQRQRGIHTQVTVIIWGGLHVWLPSFSPCILIKDTHTHTPAAGPVQSPNCLRDKH